MFKSLLSVGGFTLLSRLTGLIREQFVAAIIGRNDLSDAYNVATRLPNQFRAIFGEGAFNAAFTPTYSKILEQRGRLDASQFSAQIFSWMLYSQLALLVIAYLFMPQLVYALASGFAENPAKFALTTTLSRITFPYLLCITLVIYYSALLNVHRKFALAAFAPVLMNVAIVGFLLIAKWFPDQAHAASWGVLVSGVAQLAMLALAAKRMGLLAWLVQPRLTTDVRRFLKTAGPAVIGSAGFQIAALVDTQLGSMFENAISSMGYADRIYQLPIGVIGIAAGTVLLPQMSRLRAAGNKVAAFSAQNRVMAVTLALSMPFCIGFLTVPELIMQGAFMRGKFTAEDAHASALILAAYSFGLLAILLIRSSVASFNSVGDTKTPMMISLTALTLNVGLKFMFTRTLGAAGLALATACGAWINVGLLLFLAQRRDLMRIDSSLINAGLCTAAGAVAMNVLALFGADRLMALTKIGPELKLIAAGFLGLAVYGAAFIICARLLKFSLKLR